MKHEYSKYLYYNIYGPLHEVAEDEIMADPNPGDLSNKKEGQINISAYTSTNKGIIIEAYEDIIVGQNGISRQNYTYQAYNPKIKGEDSTILRYDCIGHHSNLDNYPHHKHIGTKVLPNYANTLQDFISEFNKLNTDGTLDKLLEKQTKAETS